MCNERCGCNSKRADDTFKVEGVKDCSIRDEIECAAKVWKSNLENSVECPFECSRSTFELSSQLAANTFSTEGVQALTDYLNYSRFELDNTTYVYNSDYDVKRLMEYFAPKLATISVEYDIPIAYVDTSEEAFMSGESLLAVIGGHLHLLLGMSLLSFAELAELLACVIWRVVAPTSDSSLKNNLQSWLQNKRLVAETVQTSLFLY